MRVLHLPTDTGGNAWGLAQGEKALGLKSHVLVSSKSFLNYPSDFCLDLDKVRGRRLNSTRQFLRKLSAFLKIRNQYDLFHFNYGTSLFDENRLAFLDQMDLPFYPKKAKLFVTYNGCDARQKYPTMKRTCVAACHNPNCYQGMCNSGEKDKKRRKRIEMMAQYAKHMWAVNPDLLYFLPPEKSSFLPYTVNNFSVPRSLPALGKKLKIVHAPTNREAKGSDFIFAAVKKLQNKYPHLVEFSLIENLPHQQAMQIYAEADLVIDQIMIGWYGAFAVETMLMGKPVIARIASNDLHFIPKAMADEVLQTVIHADPFTIDDVLEKCIHDRLFLKERSEASIQYASKWHNPQYVASLTKEKYES